MIYPMVLFPVTSNDPRFQGYRVIGTIDARKVLCAQLTRDPFAIAKFLFCMIPRKLATRQYERASKYWLYPVFNARQHNDARY